MTIRIDFFADTFWELLVMNLSKGARRQALRSTWKKWNV